MMQANSSVNQGPGQKEERQEREIRDDCYISVAGSIGNILLLAAMSTIVVSMALLMTLYHCLFLSLPYLEVDEGLKTRQDNDTLFIELQLLRLRYILAVIKLC